MGVQKTGSGKTLREALRWQVIVQLLLLLILIPLLPLLITWRWGWWQGWTAAGLPLFAMIVSRVLALRKNPDLAAERGQTTAAEGTKGWDRIIMPAVALYGPALVYVVAGLDARFAWSPGLPAAVNLVGVVVIVLGYALGTWAMVENRFFSSVVRIQTDRGHNVVSTGPYRFVRHPAYAGGIWVMPATALLLGSLWALVPAGLVVVGTVLRTALEDRTLQQELPGYAEYARQTRYRLLPGIW
jgi:protein-S-isoprenylcysteine O-methyltransferase Ste14